MSRSLPRPGRFDLAIRLVALGVVVAGCRSAPPRVDELPVSARTAWYVGSEREGASEDRSDDALLPEDAGAYVRVFLDVRRLDGPPPARLDALSHHALWLSSTARAGTLLATGDATDGVRYAPPGPAASSLRAEIDSGALPADRLAALEGYLASGTTVEFELRRTDEDPGRWGIDSSDRLVLRVSREQDAPDRVHVVLAIMLSRAGRSESTAEVVRLPSIEIASGPATEIAVPVAAGSDDGTMAAFLLRSTMRVGDDRGLVLFLGFEPSASSAEASERIARWRAENPPRTFDDVRLERQQETAAAIHRDFAAALDLIGEPRHRRASLALLARESGALLARDLVLTASEDLLAALAGHVAEHDAPEDLDALGWILEVSAFVALQEARLTDTLGDFALLSLLARRVGVVATSESRIARIVLEEADGLASFDRILEHENLDALLDPEPAARVRAYDWLARRGDAPPGYDPLDAVAERRAALEQYLQSLTEGVGE